MSKCGLFLPLLLFVTVSRSQTLLESSDGTSSLLLQEDGVVYVNFADASVKTGFIKEVSTSPWRMGGELKIKGTDGTFNLIQNKKLAADVDPKLTIGYLIENKNGVTGSPLENAIHYLALQFGYQHSSYSLGLTDAGGRIRSTDTLFNGFNVGAYYNLFGSDIVLPGDVLVGAFVNYGQKTNYSDLDNGMITTQLGIDTTGSATSTLLSTKNVKTGKYKQLSGISSGLDVVWYQHWTMNRIALAFSLRYDGTSSPDEQFIPAINLLFSQKGSPLSIIGAVTFSFERKGLVIGLQTGIPF